jgi:hypothetical protein
MNTENLWLGRHYNIKAQRVSKEDSGCDGTSNETLGFISRSAQYPATRKSEVSYSAALILAACTSHNSE